MTGRERYGTPHDVADVIWRARRERCRRIECPVLVVTGEAESQLADAAEIWSAWASSLRARTLPGGHFIPEEAAGQLSEALLEFLAA